MKSIFDKVDPRFLECVTGTCSHTDHQAGIVVWLVMSLIILNIIIMYNDIIQNKFLLKNRRKT